MTKYHLLIFSILPHIVQATIQIDKEFIPYVIAFKEIYKAKTGKVLVLGDFNMFKGDSENQEAAGRCVISNGKRTVVIRPYGWSSKTAVEKEIVVFHEFGHCFLFIVDHHPGLMGEREIDPDEYEQNRKKYIDDMFDLSPK